MADKKQQAEKVVTAPLVAAKLPNGLSAYLYRGASLEGCDAAEVKRLEELGLVGEPDDDVVPGVAPSPSV